MHFILIKTLMSDHVQVHVLKVYGSWLWALKLKLKKKTQYRNPNIKLRALRKFTLIHIKSSDLRDKGSELKFRSKIRF